MDLAFIAYILGIITGILICLFLVITGKREDIVLPTLKKKGQASFISGQKTFVEKLIED